VRGERKGGSVDADQRFARLYRDHYAAVLRYARRRTDLDSARDVAAETFLVARRRLPDVPADPAQAQPWLYGVARRVLANSDRRCCASSAGRSWTWPAPPWRWAARGRRWPFACTALAVG